jgi:hypothetical protein
MKNWKLLRASLLSLNLSTLGMVYAQTDSAPSDEDVQVFSETTSFQDLLVGQTERDRSPAAIEPLARVIALRRELGMTNKESENAAQDIILNGGTNSGLSEGLTLAVVRKIPVIDLYRENSQSELEVEFAKVKIIHVQRDVAVARLEEIEESRTGLFLGTRGVLVGDFVTRGKKR